MKNAFLTKTLLCGVMATTFFLINCQKAPNSRGVKAPAGPTDASGKTTAANAVECTQDFKTKFTEANKLATELNSDLKSGKLDNADDAKKNEIIEKLKTLQAKTNDALSEIKKAQADATACVITNQKDPRSTQTYQATSIEGLFNDLVVKLNEKGIKVDGVTEDVLTRKNKIESAKQAKSLDRGTVLNLSSDLSEVLVQANIGVVYFKAGQIIKNASNETLAKDKEDKKLTLCEIGSGTGNEDKLEKVQVADVSAITKDAKSDRSKFSVAMTSGSSTINLDCTIAENKKTEIEKEFRNVFGANLLTQEQVDTKKKATETAAKEAVSKATSALEAKETGLKDATTAVEKATAAVAAKDKEIADANAAKDDKKVKDLTAEKAELTKKLENVKAALETAKKQKADAEADLKKAKDAEAARTAKAS